MADDKDFEALFMEKRRLQAVASLLGLLLLGATLIFFGVLFQGKSAFWSAALRELGLVFAPTAVLALLYEYFAQRDHAKEVASRVSDFLEYELEHRLGGQLARSDVVAIYPARHAIDFYQFYRRANNSVDILTTNLQSMEMYLGLLIELAKQGIHVRVLSLNPRHEFVQKRFLELGLKEAKAFTDEIFVSLKHFCLERDARLSSEQHNNFELRIYDNPPSLMIFRCDYRIIIGFILQQGRSRNQLHIEFDCSPRPARLSLSNAFIEHFGILWSHAQNVDWPCLEALETTELDPEA